MSIRNTQNLAEKIADLLRDEVRSDDLLSLRESIEKINDRLTNIESQLTSQNPQIPIQNLRSVHPSFEKYKSVEALVDTILADSGTEKTCTFEPNGRPCDLCSMCSSRGF